VPTPFVGLGLVNDSLFPDRAAGPVQWTQVGLAQRGRVVVATKARRVLSGGVEFLRIGPPLGYPGDRIADIGRTLKDAGAGHDGIVGRGGESRPGAVSRRGCRPAGPSRASRC
jgi:hypothetical protein